MGGREPNVELPSVERSNLKSLAGIGDGPSPPLGEWIGDDASPPVAWGAGLVWPVSCLELEHEAFQFEAEK